MNRVLKISLVAALLLALCYSCTVTSQIQRKQFTAQVRHTPKQVQNRMQMERDSALNAQMRRDSTQSTTSTKASFTIGGASDNWEDDGQGGRMLNINIEKVSITARSRMLAERDGRVEIDFLIVFPKELQGESQNIVITPYLLKGDTTKALSELQIRGGLFSKLQDRNYWQYYKYRNTIMERCGGNPSDEDSVRLQRAFERFVEHPYLTQARFDSITKGKETVTYIYKEQVNTEDDTKKLFITLSGHIQALDGSVYYMPPSDTITFNISSVLAFVENRERYVKNIISKYASVEDRGFLSFKVGKTELIDTMGDNGAQLSKITTLMQEILYQNEYHVDNILLTASSSPEGAAQSNLALSRGRAESLRGYLRKKFDFPEMDTLLKVNWIGEDWAELRRRVEADESIENKRAVIEIIGDEKGDPDARERKLRDKMPKQYKYILENIYPKLRAVNFTYSLRRVGMIKDTIETTEIDTIYARGCELLKNRQYKQASTILYSYRDQNSAVALLSLGNNRTAREILFELPQTDIVLYLRAIVCTRLGEKRLARECYAKAVEINENLAFRARLDPEIASLMNLK